MDLAAAPPKPPKLTAGASEPTTDLSETELSPEEVKARKHRNIKLNYVSASWGKVLHDFAEATQTELVADRVPAKKFSRWDMKFYTRDEALPILNEELQPLNFRLQFKGNYLVLNALQEFRHEYAAAVLRGRVGEPEEADAAGAEQTHGTVASDAEGRAARGANRKAASSKKPAGSAPASRGKIQQVAAEDVVGPERSLDTDFEAQKPVLTTIRLKARDAVTISKVIYKAFKAQTELIDDGPRGLQGFLVRRPTVATPGKKGTRKQAGGSTVRFSIGIDEENNQLVIEATPGETKAVAKLIKALDIPPRAAQASVRAVATTKDADKLAAALQPELNRLSGATRKMARDAATGDEAEEAAEDESGSEEQPTMRQRGEPRTQPGRATQPDVPQALKRSLKGEVRVESVPELGILVLIGNDDDVQAVMSVIQEIEKLSAGTTPEVKVAFLRHVSSETLAARLTSVYERLSQVRNSTVQQSQTISVFPVSRPNAVLIVASKADLPSVYDLIDELDQPSDPAGEFRVFRLKHAVPSQVVEKVEALYPPQQPAQGTAQQNSTVGLMPRVRIIDDLRTNSVIVQARPRDIREVALLIGKLDAPDSDSLNQVRFFQLKNAVADEVAQAVSSAIQNVLAPARAVTAQGAGPGPGQPAGGQPAAAGGQGSAELREVKSTILKFLDLEGDQQRELRSGILADIRMTADLRTNTVVVTAPEESMELVAAMIKHLDRPAATTAEIKVFKVKNGDATAMQALLERLFGIQQRAGQAGAGAGQGAQPGVPGLLVEGAEDSSSMLIPLRFSVDIRTNSVIAIGGGAALNVVEAVLLTLDESDIRQRQNEVYRLKNSPATSVAQAITNFLQTQRQVETAEVGLTSPFEQIEKEVIVVPETTSNSLLISATPRYFKDIYELVLKLDRSPKQVLIQGLIVEVTLNNTDEWGMELGIQDSILFKRSPLTANPIFQTITNTTPNGVQTSTQNILSQSAVPGYLFNGQPLGNNTSPAVNQSNIGGQGGTGFNTGLTNSTLGYGGLVLQAGSENVNFLLRALAARTRVDVLSRPQIRTVDNQIAQIQVGQEVPRINGFTPSGTAGVITPTVQQRSIGIILQVTPRISPDGLVIMEVQARRDSLSNQQVSLGFSAAGTTITSPIINTTNAQTTIGVNSGQTVIVGGMITKQDNVEERKVPLLGDIPILGQAFRYDLKQMQRTELLIFLTPRIINNDEEAEMFKQIEAERLNFIESEAERMHGPLFGIPPMPPHGSDSGVIDDPRNRMPPAVPPQRGDRQVPPPPEPGLPSSNRSHSPQEPYPMPTAEDVVAPGASLMRHDDDEDLDAAFLQTSYNVPQKTSNAPGRARLTKSGGKPAEVKQNKKGPANSSPRSQPTRARESQQDPRTRVSEDS